MKRMLWLSFLFCISMTAHTAPPPAEDVFKLTANVQDPNTLTLKWKVKPGFFLYRDRVHLVSPAEENYSLGDLRYPKALKKTDQQGKIVRIYRNEMTLPVAVLGSQAGEGLLNVCFQGCSNEGFCYPPQTTQLKLTINDKHELLSVAIENQPITPSFTEMSDNTNQLKQLFSTRNWALIFLSFFGLGLLLSFTPCVLPMIPVLSGIIIGQGKHLSTHKAFLLSLSYVLSMAATYAVIGATIALVGSNLQVALQTPWAVGSFSIIFILLALSMFGFYNLQLPSSWQTKLSKLSHSKAGGYYLGAAIMGCLSTLILSPCVTAPLIGALGYIASTGDVARGSLALFFLGLGMGTPLLIIGTSAGKWIPKAGAWMDIIKSFFGLLLLAVAIELLGRILPSTLTMGLWASLLIFTGIYAGALAHADSNQDKFRQGVGIISLVYGILILIGASQGNQNPLQPLLLQPLSKPGTTELINYATVKTLTDAQHELALAQAKGIPVVLDFYADWCATCQHIEATTLKNPDVKLALSHVIFLKIDVTENNNASHALMNYFNVIAPPTFIFYDAEGTEQTHQRLVGDISAHELMNKLEPFTTSHPTGKTW